MLCWHTVEGLSWHAPEAKAATARFSTRWASRLLETLGKASAVVGAGRKTPHQNRRYSGWSVGDPSSCLLKRLASSMACSWCMFTSRLVNTQAVLQQAGLLPYNWLGTRQNYGPQQDAQTGRANQPPLGAAVRDDYVPETESEAEPTAHHLAGSGQARDEQNNREDPKVTARRRNPRKARGGAHHSLPRHTLLGSVLEAEALVQIAPMSGPRARQPRLPKGATC